jgi:ubiquinone biosynthesis protein UbiJ
MSSIVAAVIDRALGAAVARARIDSPQARALLADLAGRRVTVAARGTPWIVTIACTATELRVEPLEPGASADASISGTPLSLLALARTQPGALVQRGEVRIDGDAEVARQFSRLALLLRPDLEHELSGVLGRSGAHVIMRGLRGAAAWSRAAAWTAVQNLSEYLAHERGDLVSLAEAAHFLRGVDDLRDQLGRLEARVAQLESTDGREPA